jgi:hypothetical protein
VHDPTRCNYPHTEIRAHENETPVHDIGPKTVKKRIREALAERIAIELPREIAGARFAME